MLQMKWRDAYVEKKMDSLTPEKRSWNMSQIKCKDTSIEKKVRQYLFSKGFRYRKNDQRYPGRPDVVLPKYHTMIFINGCFWHQHVGCFQARLPKTNIEYWRKKLEVNVKNDSLHYEQLTAMGWSVIVLWECELKKNFDNTMDAVVESLHERYMDDRF